MQMNQCMENENTVVTGPVLKSIFQTKTENTFQSVMDVSRNITHNARLSKNNIYDEAEWWLVREMRFTDQD